MALLYELLYPSSSISLGRGIRGIIDVMLIDTRKATFFSYLARSHGVGELSLVYPS
jgi:hypothetical protein